ncbi:MAG: UbiA family prenyltransferase [Succinivibrio sp.]|nr:UbiA family prenyltransferase [Succinivibrio sp.]
MNESSIPLVCDLDGTLLRTDTLHELILRAVATDLLTLLRAILLLITRGRLPFKIYLAEHIQLDPALLPYNSQVVALLRTARDSGRKTVLATASSQSIAEGVAANLCLFDTVYGSTPFRNLKGTAKAELLTSLYGAKGVDYIGDSKVDHPVFAAARCAYVANPFRNTLTLLNKTDERATDLTISKSPGDEQGEKMAPSPVIRALRPHQWAKNALIFAPLLLAHDFSPDALIASFTAFMIFCAAASAGYIINDCLDLPADRAHPVKCKRPFASGALSPLPWFVGAALMQLALPLIAVLMLPLHFALCLGCYIVLNLCYSFKFKQLLFLDVIVLTSLYVLRVIAGACAIDSPLSAWVMLCSCFAFLTLALVKRLTELTRLRGSQTAVGNGSEGGDTPPSAISRRAYRTEDRLILAALAAASACSTVFTLILYAFEDAATRYYQSPIIIAFTALPVFFAFGRLLLLACRGSLRYDPVMFVLRDKASLCCALCCGALYLLASFCGVPWL